MNKISIICQNTSAFIEDLQKGEDFYFDVVLLNEGFMTIDFESILLFVDVDFNHPSLSIPHNHKYYVFSKDQRVVRDTISSLSILKEKGFKSFVTEELLSTRKLNEFLGNFQESSGDIQYQHDLVLDSMGDALILLDEEERIVLINKAAHKLLGLKSNGETREISEIFRLVNDGFSIDFSRLLEKAKKTGQPVGLSNGTKLMIKDGTERFISANVAPLLSNHKLDMKGYILIFRDITRVVNAEMRIRLFSNIIRTSLNYIIIINRKLSIIYTNDGFNQAFQDDENPLFSKSIKEVPQLKQLDFEKIVAHIQNYTHFTDEVELIVAGQTRTFLMQGAQHETGSEAEVYYFNFIDIHEQKNIENTLTRERKVFQDVFYHSPIGISILDEHHRIVQTNKSFSEMFQVELPAAETIDFGTLIDCRGKDELELCGQGETCNTCMINEIAGKIIECRQKVLGSEFTIWRTLNGKNVQLAIRMSGVPVDHGDKVRALLLFEDITQTKEFEKIRIRNERQLRVITDNMQEAVTYLASDGSILYASPSHEKLIGYKAEELVGTNFFDHIEENRHHETKEQLFQRIQRKSVYSAELSLKRRDGSSVWVETTGSLLKNDDLTESVILVSRDITIKHKTLEEMQRVKEMAIAANTAKSEFLANMSHEIRTPMNGIIGMTNLTLLTQLDTNQRENLQMVRSSAESLLKIINSILDFSKIEAGKLTIETVEFQLDTLLNRMKKTFHLQTSQKNIDFRIVTQCDPKSYVLGDINRLTQVLNNLIGNAIKFTDAGYVELKVTEMHQTLNEIDLMFEVVDTGIGIETKFQYKMFESFSQADGSITRRFGGTGLGLSITKQLVDLMGGTIDFESVMHQGSRFYFNMKFKKVFKNLVRDNVVQDEIPEAVYRGRILLVEDDKINQILAKRLLDKQGHDVTIAENGQIAVDLVGKTEFDLILMDIQMPVMDGIEATKRIRAIPGCEDIPIIALTAYAIKGDRDRFLSLGMDEYISKPIDMPMFYKVINELLKKRSKKEYEPVHVAEKKASTRGDWENFSAEFDVYHKNACLAFSKKGYEELEKQAHFIKILCMSISDEDIKRKSIKLELAARKEVDEEIQLALNAIKELVEEKMKIQREVEE